MFEKISFLNTHLIARNLFIFPAILTLFSAIGCNSSSSTDSSAAGANGSRSKIIPSKATFTLVCKTDDEIGARYEDVSGFALKDFFNVVDGPSFLAAFKKFKMDDHRQTMRLADNCDSFTIMAESSIVDSINAKKTKGLVKRWVCQDPSENSVEVETEVAASSFASALKVTVEITDAKGKPSKILPKCASNEPELLKYLESTSGLADMPTSKVLPAPAVVPVPAVPPPSQVPAAPVTPPNPDLSI